MVADRLRAGMKIFRERYGTPSALVAAGGVAANQAIRKVLHRLAFEAGTALVVPPAELCTDNGAMIAWAGAERLALGLTDTLDATPHARWPLRRDRPATAPRRRRSTPAPTADRQPAHDLRAHRGDRGRRLGHGAGQRRCAGRPRGDAVGARRASAEAIAATRAKARGCRACGSTNASAWRTLGPRPASADAILLAVPAQALRDGRAAIAPRCSRRHAGRRLRQGHRARHASAS